MEQGNTPGQLSHKPLLALPGASFEEAQRVISTMTRVHSVCISKHTRTQSLSMDWNDAGEPVSLWSKNFRQIKAKLSPWTVKAHQNETCFSGSHILKTK